MELENVPALSSHPQKTVLFRQYGWLFSVPYEPSPDKSSSRKLAAGCSVAGISAVSRKSNIDLIGASLDRQVHVQAAKNGAPGNN
jgi:hypothetical protein